MENRTRTTGNGEYQTDGTYQKVYEQQQRSDNVCRINILHLTYIDRQPFTLFNSNKADAEILPRAQLASKIAKPKSSPKVAMPKHETNPTNVPMKTSETKKSFIVDPKQKKNIKPVQMSSKDEKKATFKKSTL